MVERVVSGGQTGVDRAALDAALALGIPCGGWCPSGRRAEDGVLDARYPLRETPSEDYAERTEWNVRDSDGTLILCRAQPLTGGTAMTAEFAQRWRKPYHVVALQAAADVSSARTWAGAQRIRVLNVAGPRESKAPGIYGEAEIWLRVLLGRGA